MTTQAPASERGRQTRSRIFESAAGLMAERGYDFTLEDVAAQAGTTRMTVYRHVGSRDDLLTSLLLRASNDLARELRVVLDRDGPFVERIADAVVLMVARVRAAPHLTAVLSSANPSHAWPQVDPEGRFVHVVFEFFGPYFEAAKDEVTFRAPTEQALDWLMREVLGLLTVDSQGQTDLAEVRRLVETFVIPSIVVDH